MGVAISPLGDAAELHNLTIEDGRAVVRPAYAVHKEYADPCVGAFSVLNPRTSSPWHYVFTRAASGVVTLTVADETFATIFTVGMGVTSSTPHISWGIVNNQIMIGSPSFSSTYYGIVGSGIIPARATTSPNAAVTTLDIPTGHVCAWKDRFVIAQGNVLFVNTGELDPRTFIAQNAIPLPGQILDLFEGPDGGLWVFTSRDVYVLAADALSQSQIAIPFMTTIPNIATSAPANAVATFGTVLALAHNGIVQVSTSTQTKIDVQPYAGPRALTPDTHVADLRACRIYRTSTGAVVSYGEAAPVCLVVDLRNKFRSYFWSRWHVGTVFETRSVVGALTTREGRTLLVFSSARPFAFGIIDPDTGLPVDVTSSTMIVEPIGNRGPRLYEPRVAGVSASRAALPADASPVVRFVSVATNNVGGTSAVSIAGATSAISTPTETDECIVGTSTWTHILPLPSAKQRTVRHAFAVRVHEVAIEVGIDGAGASFDASDVEVRGQGRARRSRA